MKYGNPWASITGSSVVYGEIRSDEHTLEVEKAETSVVINCEEAKFRWDIL